MVSPTLSSSSWSIVTWGYHHIPIQLKEKDPLQFYCIGNNLKFTVKRQLLAEISVTSQHTDYQIWLVEILVWNMIYIFYLIWACMPQITGVTPSGVWVMWEDFQATTSFLETLSVRLLHELFKDCFNLYSHNKQVKCSFESFLALVFKLYKKNNASHKFTKSLLPSTQY